MSLWPHTLILPFAIPFAATPILWLGTNPTRVWRLTCAILISLVAISGLLLYTTWGAPHFSLSYLIGGWSAQLGINYSLNRDSALILFTVASISCLCFYSLRFSKSLDNATQIRLYGLWLLNTGANLSLLLSHDIFHCFVLLEITSLTACGMLATASEASTKAALQYLITTAIGSAFFLLGIGYLLALTGILKIDLLKLALSAHQTPLPMPLLTGMLLVVAGLCLKAALFPLHGWLRSFYLTAPTPLAAYFAGSSTSVVIVVLWRIVAEGFDQQWLLAIISWVGIASVIYGTYAALQNRNLRSILVNSSISHLGMVAMMIGLGSAAANQAAIWELCHHAVAKCLLFLVVGSIYKTATTTRKEHFARWLASAPLPAAIGLFAMLSLCGIPGTPGFAIKWLMLTSSLASGNYIVLATILLASLGALWYYSRYLVEITRT